MSTNTAHTQTTYTDARKTTTGKDKDASDFRVFVEQDGKTIIVAYKKTMRAAQMASNKIGREHAYGSITSWGWETRDKYNQDRW